MAADVDWDFARSIAARIGGEEPFGDSYHAASLDGDLIRLTEQAERLVEAETGLFSASGPARARVTDRAGWVDANLASFERLMRPLIGRLNADSDGADSDGADGDDDGDGADSQGGVQGVPQKVLADIGRAFGSVSSAVGPKVAGAEMGALLGWMSTRVLGQYDLLIAEDDKPDEQDWVYYVGPNLLALEKRYGFPPEEFRLWIAVHECTHRAQFTGVPWLRPYFLSLVNELIDSVEPDPKAFMDTLQTAVKEARAGDGPSLKDGGISMLLASPQQRETMKKVSGLMSLLEGHGDIIMDRATRDLIPSQARFARVMSQRRKNAGLIARFIQRLTGMEAKMAQYEEGEDFVRAVEAAGGKELFDLVWTGPEWLPTIDEIRDPDLWITRVRTPAGA